MANIRFSPPNSWIVDCDCGRSHTVTGGETTSGGSDDDDIDTGWGTGPRTHTVTVPTSDRLRDPSMLEEIQSHLRQEPEPATVWQVKVTRGPIALPDLEGLIDLQRREGRAIVVSSGPDDERGTGDAGR